ncbi:MAG: Gldg family protein [Deltaproteobacteria bacterium]|nr:Gldg family protein [Deltaproteobacteria bacterium]
MERKVRARTESVAFVAIIIASLVLFNILSLKAFGRLDLTKRQIFTLSDGTRRIVRGLNDQLTITVYFTANQPPPANDDERFLHDQLDEYRNASGGRVRVVYVTPDTDDRRRQADAAGCVKAPLQSVDQRQEQATIQEVYRCVAFEYLGRRDKLEFLPPGVQGLEYEISSIIKNLALPEGERERTIGFLGGHGELTPEEGLQYMPQFIEQARLNYRTRTVNLNGGDNDVPTDIKGLIIMNPLQRISEREMRKLDAYLMRGGSVAIFGSGVNFPATDPGSATGTVSEHHLNDWLSEYGVSLQPNVILDLRATDAVVAFGRYRGRVRLVTWPEIASFSGTPSAQDMLTQGGMDPRFPVTFRLPGFISTYPSEIRIDESKRRATGGELNVFARTGPNSILRTDFNIDIRQILQQGPSQFQNAAQHGPYAVGVALQGPFRSAFAGRAETASNDAGAPAVVAANSNVPQRSTDRARLMVISSGNMFALDTLRTLIQLSQGQPPANLAMLSNTFDWMSQDTDLLAVRAKDTSDPQIRADVSDKAKQFFKWGSIALLPAAIGVLGLAVLSARRARIKDLAKEFGPKA